MYLFKMHKNGFTIIELLIALLMAAVLSIAVFSLFQFQYRTFEVQEQVVDLHQTMRASMELMQRDLRATGYDPVETDNFGIVDIRNRDASDNFDANGEGAIVVTADLDSSGGTPAGDEGVIYRIYDSAAVSDAGVLDLGRQLNDGSAVQPLGGGIENISFAFAYADSDGSIVMNPNAPVDGSPEPLWAFDSDNDNVLDRAVDTNSDGTIDINDAETGAVLPNLISGANLIPLTRVRAVKIWMLGRALQADQNYRANNLQFKVGDRIEGPFNDNIRRQLLTTVVKFRNLGL
jgi:prepilin-type N-terminal cleavage/methylation domain-containing protein